MKWASVSVAIAAGVIVAASDSTLAQSTASPAGVADLVQMAVEHNREFLAAKQRVAETQGLLRQAGVRPAPAIEVEESSSRPFGSRGEQVFSAGYFHTIETFGKRDKRITVAEKSAAAADAELADRLRLLACDVKIKYAQAVREQRKLEAIQRLSSMTREYYSLTSARVRSGDAAPIEGQLFLTDVSRVDAQQVVLANSADRALIELRKTVGLASSEPLMLGGSPPVITAASLEDLQARALRDRPDLRSMRLLEEQSAAEELLTQAEAKPNLTASLRYARSDTRFDQLAYDAAGQLSPIRDRDQSLALGLSILLFSPNRNQGAMDAARARTTASRLRREHLESIVRLEVEAAFRRWQAAARAADILTSGVVGQSERNLTVIRQAYTLGQLRVLDVLSEQRRLIETQLTYLDVQSELLEAGAELEASVGGSLQ